MGDNACSCSPHGLAQQHLQTSQAAKTGIAVMQLALYAGADPQPGHHRHAWWVVHESAPHGYVESLATSQQAQLACHEPELSSVDLQHFHEAGDEHYMQTQALERCLPPPPPPPPFARAHARAGVQRGGDNAFHVFVCLENRVCVPDGGIKGGCDQQEPRLGFGSARPCVAPFDGVYLLGMPGKLVYTGCCAHAPHPGCVVV